jgi:hypothetical protein
MNNVIRLFNRLLIDISHNLGVRISAPHDIDMAWIVNDGPRLDKELLGFLEHQGKCPEFPSWMFPLWREFYNATTFGLVGPTPYQCSVLRAIRQILVFGYKAEYEPTKSQQSEAQASFVETDTSLDTFNDYFSSHRGSPFFSGAKKFISRVIAKCDFRSIGPFHGPGSVYPSFAPSEKSSFDTIYDPIDELYPYFDFFEMTTSQIMEGAARSARLKSQQNIVAKLTCVPKDSRGPRLISVHPREAIWIQQGLRTVLEDAICRHPLTRESIRFADQKVNQRMALQSSVNRRFATIDLKDASDRISLELFRYLFGSASRFFECCRASHVCLFDGSLHPLRKYAPMGNATAFPIESIIFWALVRSGIECHYGVICDDIDVFGDDIIVPSKYYHGVMQALIRSGLVPNPGKCFHKGLFRESCGVDAFNGFDITPIRIKTHNVTSQLDLVSLCALGKNLRVAGYEETACQCYSIVRKHQKVLPLSNNLLASGIVEYVDWSWERIARNEPTFKWDRNKHIYVTRHLQVKAIIDSPSQHDWYHVLDSLNRIRKGEISERGLEYTIPYRTRCNYGWTPVYTRESERIQGRRVLSEQKSTLSYRDALQLLGAPENTYQYCL